MSSDELHRALAPFEADGLEAEVFVKRGRCRTFAVRLGQRSAVYTREAGWALRSGGVSGSSFACGGGPLPATLPRLESGGSPFRLPQADSGEPWRPPPGLDAPLLGEREARGLLEALERALTGELRGARLVWAMLEEGSSEVELASTRGVAVGYRSRLASARLEGVVGGAARQASLQWVGREARSFDAVAAARRLAVLLSLFREGRTPERDRAECVLAPEVGARLLAALMPLFLGGAASARARVVADRSGRLASDCLTVVDDGRFPEGALAAPVDGEGVPTRRLVLVEAGIYRRPLLPWWETPAGQRAVGCSRRPGWRDRPRPGASHLFVAPDATTPPSSLLSSIGRGYYLVSVDGAVEIDFDSGRFALPVSGFAVRRGRAQTPITGARLCGSIGGFLRNVQGVGRDLAFLPLEGLIGTPSLLVSGLELRPV